MDEEQGLEQLYNEFKASLADNKADIYFDEQDLVDIFDYAGDVNDDYIRLEALIIGARLYPQSNELKKRHAIFLADVNPDSFRELIKDNSNNTVNKDLTWTILNAKAIHPKGDRTINLLNYIADNFRFTADEDTIQFVNLAAELNQEKWLLNNLDHLKNITDYHPTLVYETAQVIHNAGMTDKAIELMEEMTMQEPFNINYWIFLAELQASQGRFEDSLTSIEYAKAINASSPVIHSIEGYIHILMGEYDKAIPILEKAHSENPADVATKRNLMEAYRQMLENDKATVLMKELFALDSTDRSLMLIMVTTMPESIPEILQAYYKSSDKDSNLAVQNIYEIYQNGFTQEALSYAIWFSHNIANSKALSLMKIELLYALNHYSEAVLFAEASIELLTLEYNEMYCLAILASAMMRTGQFVKAATLCRHWIPIIEESQNMTIQGGIINYGTIQILKGINDLLAVNIKPSQNEILKVVLKSRFDTNSI